MATANAAELVGAWQLALHVLETALHHRRDAGVAQKLDELRARLGLRPAGEASPGPSGPLTPERCATRYDAEVARDGPAAALPLAREALIRGAEPGEADDRWPGLWAGALLAAGEAARADRALVAAARPALAVRPLDPAAFDARLFTAAAAACERLGEPGADRFTALAARAGPAGSGD